MASVLIGLCLALASAAAYGAAVTLQASQARLVGVDEGLRLVLARSLIAKRRWLVGAVVGVLGWPLQAAALLFAPLVVVQPALTFGLVVLLACASRLLDEHVGRREWLALVALIAGVIALVNVAPARVALHGGGRTAAPILIPLAVIAVIPLLLRRRIVHHGRLVALGGGAGYASASLTTKLLSDDVRGHAWYPVAAWLVACALLSGMGALCEMTAYQTAPATSVSSIVFTIEIVVPSAAAVTIGGERPHGALALTALLAAVALLVTAAAVLARSRSIADLHAAASRGAGAPA